MREEEAEVGFLFCFLMSWMRSAGRSSTISTLHAFPIHQVKETDNLQDLEDQKRDRDVKQLFGMARS